MTVVLRLHELETMISLRKRRNVQIRTARFLKKCSRLSEKFLFRLAQKTEHGLSAKLDLLDGTEEGEK